MWKPFVLAVSIVALAAGPSIARASCGKGGEAAVGGPAAAGRIYEAIRADDLAGLVHLTPAEREVRDRQGATPLMHAALTGSPAALRALLDAGAAVDARNAFEATALLCAGGDPVKSRLLIEHGADVNARTALGWTPLLAAAGRDGNAELVRLLLARGADATVRSVAGDTPLLSAARHGDVETMRLLIEAGADVNPARTPLGMTPLGAAVSSGRTDAVRLLLAAGARPDVPAMDDSARVRNGTISLQKVSPLMLAAPYGPLEMTEILLRAGVDPGASDRRGMTALMLATASERSTPEVVSRLLAAGADPHVRSERGDTAGSWARAFNRPAIRRRLPGDAHPAERPASRGGRSEPATSALAALERAIGLLQRSSAQFDDRAGCVACHHQPLTALAVSAARRAGVAVDREAAAAALDVMRESAAKFHARALQGTAASSGIDIVLGHAQGLADAEYVPDVVTDGLVATIAIAQRQDGRWGRGPALARPPMNDGDIARTARAVAALRTFGPPARRAELDARIDRARAWLLATEPLTTDDHVMRLLGLVWSGAERSRVGQAAARLQALQRSDGGWGGNPGLASDAFSTGEALYALRESGRAASAAAHRRGVRYLRARQAADGSWHVASRAVEFQPYFESGFPYGRDQWISAAATAWASTALAADVGGVRAAARSSP